MELSHITVIWSLQKLEAFQRKLSLVLFVFDTKYKGNGWTVVKLSKQYNDLICSLAFDKNPLTNTLWIRVGLIACSDESWETFSILFSKSWVLYLRKNSCKLSLSQRDMSLQQVNWQFVNRSYGFMWKDHGTLCSRCYLNVDYTNKCFHQHKLRSFLSPGSAVFYSEHSSVNTPCISMFVLPAVQICLIYK